MGYKSYNCDLKSTRIICHSILNFFVLDTLLKIVRARPLSG